jgi:hypothetical protein
VADYRYACVEEEGEGERDWNNADCAEAWVARERGMRSTKSGVREGGVRLGRTAKAERSNKAWGLMRGLSMISREST